MVDREANLTGLYYFHDRPLASGPDTVEVVLVVCREQGLQQVVWVGRPLDGPAHVTAREAIRSPHARPSGAKGVRRYGEPRPGLASGSLVWLSGRAVLATRTLPYGARELVISASGPDYAACSENHRTATGHPAGAHMADLIGGMVP
ncbi:threonyl-trna synthetase [Methylobacterium sp. J-026]|jgi:hypothetical protein|nr:threonyl-trna synthetase [Methylobacterium sp. J-026]MCJ2136905.1 threonyl-trna synthetase [Methylobacterium sp. J-026]